MAEVAGVAAGLIVAEEIVTTTAQIGIVYGLAKKTLPLKATVSQIGDVVLDSSPDSLARYSHTTCCIGNEIFIFGGLVASDQFAGNEMHIINIQTGDYKAIPALSRDETGTPSPRAGHTATVVNDKIVVFGGYSTANKDETLGILPLDEGGRVWIYHPTSMFWSFLDVANDLFPIRYDHGAVTWDAKLIVHGGLSGSSQNAEVDTWSFDFDTRNWTELPRLSTDSANAIISTSPPNFTIVDNRLYVLTGSSELSGEIHTLDLFKSEWSTIEFATNPLVPGPRPRKGGGLHAVKTGMGRTYLCSLFGQKEEIKGSNKVSDEHPEFWSGMWALQVPSAPKSAAKLKDATRAKIGASTHELEWGEVEIIPQTEVKDSGKSHPGPRAHFGSVAVDSSRILLWGGLNPTGQTQPDGWLVHLKT